MILLGGWESTSMERDRGGNPHKPKNCMFLFLGELKYPVGSMLGKLGVGVKAQSAWQTGSGTPNSIL